MKTLRTIVLLLWAIFCLSSCRQNTGILSQLVVCGDDKVLIIEPGQTPQQENRIIWQWNVAEASTQLPPKYQTLMVPLDECKLVDKNSKLLLTSSGGGALLLDKATKKCLFYADVPMAHSAELLPNNKIAIALSTHPQGNSLEIYDVSHPEQVLYRDTLYSGHGAVWMPKEERLYALGFDELRSYEIKEQPNDSVTLILDKRWKLPSEGGHDLSPTDNHQLLISTHNHVYVFNSSKETFQPFSPLANTRDVKSINLNKAKEQLIYTKAKTDWWTNHIYINQKGEQTIISVDSIRIYKVRTAR